MRLLVTGHKGFIGSHLFASLRSEGQEVYGFDVNDQLQDKDYDIIFHLAARGLIRKSIEKPFEYFSDNLGLTIRILEIARKHNSTVVFPTSGSVAEPTNPYSLAKKHSVDWIKLYGKLYGIESYILKFYNIYGTGSRKGAVYLFTKAAMDGETAVIFGDGSHVRDFFNVRDVVRGCIQIVNGELSPGEYEFGSGKGTSVNSLISLVEEITGKQLKLEKKDYVVNEAEQLVAKKPILKNPISLYDGVHEVIEFINIDRGDAE